jgi:hypothetical protein
MSKLIQAIRHNFTAARDSLCHVIVPPHGEGSRTQITSKFMTRNANFVSGERPGDTVYCMGMEMSQLLLRNTSLPLMTFRQFEED